MQRRSFVSAAALGTLSAAAAPLAALLAAAPRAARAHHGWSSFDPGRPLYLAGRVVAVRWRNPHAEVDLEVQPRLALPRDLAARAVPEQTTPLDSKDILARTVLPVRADGTWTIELAPLTRMRAWSVEPLREGETIEVVGYTFTGERGDKVMRAEWLFRDGKAYGLRSSPAG
jgi:hypothetical protein